MSLIIIVLMTEKDGKSLRTTHREYASDMYIETYLS